MKSRLSIALFFLVFSTGLLCAFALISQQFLSVSLTEMQDKRLLELAAYLRTEIELDHGRPVLRLDEEPAAGMRGATIQIFDQHEILRFEYGHLSPRSLQTGFSDYNISGQSVRVTSISVKDHLWLQLAIPNDEKLRALVAYGNMLRLFLPVALILVCLSSFYFSGFVLGPIERSLQELRGFLVDVGHELRTPITIALSNVQAMQMDLIENRIEPQRLEAAERAILRMNRLVEDLFLLARSENATVTFRVETLDFAALSRSIINQHEEAFSAKRIALTFSGAQALVKCDAEAIARVIENLLENALRYTPDGGSVGVTVEQKGNTVLLGISDTGIGIPKELQSKVFERFFRVEESRDRHSGGAGLGLSIVKSIVELNGGRVWLESDIGKGSKFYVEIPAAA